MPRLLSWRIHFSIIGPYPSFRTLSSIFLYRCTFRCCHGDNFTFFPEFSLAGLTFGYSCFPPRNYLPPPCPSKDCWCHILTVTSPIITHAHLQLQHAHLRQLFTSLTLDGLWSCLNISFISLLHATASKLSFKLSLNTMLGKRCLGNKGVLCFALLLNSRQYWEGSIVPSVVF